MTQTTRRDIWVDRLSKWHAYAIVAIFLTMGALMFFAAFGGGRKMRLLLASQDVLLGISNHMLLLIAGIIHFAIGIYLLGTSHYLSRGVVTCWAGFSYLSYRFGMASSGSTNPIACVLATAESVGIEPGKLDRAWWLVILFYIISGVVVLALEWRFWRLGKENTFAKRWREYRVASQLAATGARPPIAKGSWVPGFCSGCQETLPSIESESNDFKFICPNCGQHIQCNTTYSGRGIACPRCQKVVIAIRSGELKMTCFFCKGNIAFQAHSAGTKLPCPHCKMDITLMDNH